MNGPLFREPEAWRVVQARDRRKWADRYELEQPQPLPRHACLVWLTRGRHNANACLTLPRWADHPSAWRTPTGGRVLLVQPYNFEAKYLEMSRAINAYPQVYLRFERNGWHHPDTTLVELWENEDVYWSAIESRK